MWRMNIIEVCNRKVIEFSQNDRISQSNNRNLRLQSYEQTLQKKTNIGLFKRAFSPKTSSEFSSYFSLIFPLFFYLLGSSVRYNHVGCYSPQSNLTLLPSCPIPWLPLPLVRLTNQGLLTLAYFVWPKFLLKT